MANMYVFIAALAMAHCASQATDSQCSSGFRFVSLSVSSTKNDSGNWTCLLSTSTEQSITMDVMHNITECNGRRDILLQGSFRKVGEPEKGMVFHSKVGSNVIISNNGKTIEKKNNDERYNGTAFTSRPLKNDELFEVILDKREQKFWYCFAIGVLTVRPEDFELPARAYHSPLSWMYHHTSIYSNGTDKRTNYGVDIDYLPAGTRFGVMRNSSDGDVHFYVNGDDQGSAKLGISGPVYGVVELNANAQKITILNP